MVDTRFLKIIEERRKLGQTPTFNQAPLHEVVKTVPKIDLDTKLAAFAGNIILNDKQLEAVMYAKEKKDFCLIGAAGTGKTTTVREMAEELLRSMHIERMAFDTKNLRKGDYAIAFVSFTNRAVNNIKKAVPEALKFNCMTIHALLEYEPRKIMQLNKETEEMEEVFRFVPARTGANPMHLDYVVIDESSMCDVYLHKQLKEACPWATFIYLGDLNQMVPVYGDGVLGYKLSELPVIELTHVYRQALDSPIIQLAYKILAGKSLACKELEAIAVENNLIFHPWKKNSTQEEAQVAAGRFLYNLVVEDKFNCITDVVLCPFNKNFGSIYLNKKMAQGYSDVSKLPVWEIRAGYELFYYSVGDKLMYEKKECIITDIKINARYIGKGVRRESVFMDRFGVIKNDVVIETHDPDDEDAIFGSLDCPMYLDDSEDKVNQASHIITLRFIESGWERVISLASEINTTDFSYVMSVHKAQGSEWENVYLMFHKCHNVMVNRELLYTAVTRAREKLYIVYSPESKLGAKDGTFQSGVTKQKIKGLTYKDKIKYFVKKKESGKVGDHILNPKHVMKEEDDFIEV